MWIQYNLAVLGRESLWTRLFHRAEARTIQEAVANQLLSVLGRGIPHYTALSRQRYATTNHCTKTDGAYTPEVLAWYRNETLGVDVFWIAEVSFGREARFFVVVEPLNNPVDTYRLALEVFGEIEQVLSSIFRVASHRLRFGGVDHFFTVVEAQFSFWTSEISAAMLVLAVLGGWLLFQHRQPPTGDAEATYHVVTDLLLGAGGSALIVVLAGAGAWPGRKARRHSDRKVVYRDGK